MFPIEAGHIDTNDRIIPSLPGNLYCKSGMENMNNIDTYGQNLDI